MNIPSLCMDTPQGEGWGPLVQGRTRVYAPRAIGAEGPEVEGWEEFIGSNGRSVSFPVLNDGGVAEQVG